MSCILQSAAMLRFNRQLFWLLEALLLVTQRTSLLLLLRGRFPLSCSLQSPAMLRFKRKLLGLLDTLSVVTQGTRLLLDVMQLSNSC